MDLLPAVKNRLRDLSPGQWAMVVSLIICLAILLWPQNRGSAWQSVSGLAFSPDSNHLAIGVYSGRFRALRERWYLSDLFHTAVLASVNDLAGATVLGRTSRPGIFNILPEVLIGQSVAFSADGRRLISAGFNGDLFLWDAAQRRLVSNPKTERLHFRSLASLKQGNRYAAAFRQFVYLGDFDSDVPLQGLQVGPNVQSLAPAPDGSRFAVGGLGTLDLEVWSAEGKLLERIDAPAPPDNGDLPPTITALAWLPDGKTLVAANDKTIEIVDLERHKVIAVLPERLVLAIAVSPDGKQLATGRFDGLTLWDLPQRKKTEVHFDVPAVESVQFSPDGRRLAAGSDDGTVRIWNLPNYEPAGTWTFTRPNDAGVAQFLRIFPLLAWIAVYFYRHWLWRSQRAEALRAEALPRV